MCASVLMVNVDNTILNVALPTLVRELQATSSELEWIVDAYAMAFAGLLFVGGSLADRFGRKRFFLLGLAVFTGGSIGAAFAPSVQPLIACRAVMGAGAALAIPASLAIINDVFRDPVERGRAIGAWAGTMGLGVAIGPIAGGLLLSRFWWGSIFLVNVPIALAGLVGALVLVPDSRNPAADRPDPIGSILSIAGLGLLLWAIIEAPAEGWTSGIVVTVGFASIVVMGTFVTWEAHSSHPMLRLELFAERRFSAAMAGEALGVFALLGALFVQTQFLQFDLGFSPLQAGVRILPIAAVICLVAPLSPVVARVIGVKLAATAGLAAIGGGLCWIAALSTVASTYGEVVPGMLLIGLGAGLLLPTATNSVLGSVPTGDSGVGSATNTVALQVGGALGVAVVGSTMSTRYQEHLTASLVGRHVPTDVLRTILGSLGGALAVAERVGGATGAELAHAARVAFMGGSRVGMAVGGTVALCGAVVVLVALPPGPADRPEGSGAAVPGGRTASHLPTPRSGSGSGSGSDGSSPECGVDSAGPRSAPSGRVDAGATPPRPRTAGPPGRRTSGTGRG